MSARPSSKRTLNQAVRKLRDRASELGLPPAVITALKTELFVRFGGLCFCICTSPPEFPKGCIWLNYRDDSSMRAAIDELKKAAAQT